MKILNSKLNINNYARRHFNYKKKKCVKKRHKWIWHEDTNRNYVGICKYCKEINDDYRPTEGTI